jgi:hypothetical protein
MLDVGTVTVGHRLVAESYKPSHYYDHHLEYCAVGSLPVQLGNTSGAGKCRSTETNNNNNNKILPSKGTIWCAEHTNTKMSRKEGKGFKILK